MTALLWVFLGLVAAVLVLLIGVIALPVHFRLKAEVGDEARTRSAAQGRISIEVRLFGGVAPPLRFSGGGGRTEPPPPVTEAREEPRARRKRRGWRMPGGPGVGRRILRAVPDLISGELRRIHIDCLSVDGEFGLADPADTGRLYGYLTPVIYAVPSRRMSVNLRPDFSRACLSGQAEAALHLTPAALAWPVARFAWTVFVAGR